MAGSRNPRPCGASGYDWERERANSEPWDMRRSGVRCGVGRDMVIDYSYQISFKLYLYLRIFRSRALQARANSARCSAAEKANFGHLTSITTARRQMVECSPNGHAMATLTAAQQPSARSWNNKRFLFIFVYLLSLFR